MIKEKDRSRVIRYIKQAAELQKALNECKKQNNEKEYLKLLIKQAELKDKLRNLGATDKFINSTFKLIQKSINFSNLMIKTFEIKKVKREKFYSTEYVMLWKRCNINKDKHLQVIKYIKTIAIFHVLLNGLEKSEKNFEGLDLIKNKIKNFRNKLKVVGVSENFINMTFKLLKKDPRYYEEIIEIIQKGANVKLN